MRLLAVVVGLLVSSCATVPIDESECQTSHDGRVLVAYDYLGTGAPSGVDSYLDRMDRAGAGGGYVGGEDYVDGDGSDMVLARGGATRVRSYTTKRGTYVPSHYRTARDGAKSNNWSTKGNSNPYTGKRGSK